MIAHEIWNGSFVCLLGRLSTEPHAVNKLREVPEKVKERCKLFMSGCMYRFAGSAGVSVSFRGCV